MKSAELLLEIFETKLVYDLSGKSYPLSSNIDQQEGLFLRHLIQTYQPTRTIEIGCAQGISSLYICGALQHRENTHHTIIDGWQSSTFNNIGIANLRRAGIENFELIEGLSELVLPELLKQGKKYHLGFIDGNHTFDHTLIDFFYLNRLIDIGGIIIIDDVGMPAINKVARYILNYPAYKLVGSVQFNLSKRRSLLDQLKKPIRFTSKLFPKNLRSGIFAGDIISSDQSLQLNASMIALQKIAKDDRSWNWFEDF